MLHSYGGLTFATACKVEFSELYWTTLAETAVLLLDYTVLNCCTPTGLHWLKVPKFCLCHACQQGGEGRGFSLQSQKKTAL